MIAASPVIILIFDSWLAGVIAGELVFPVWVAPNGVAARAARLG